MSDDTLNPHPIQAIHIAPRELRIKAHTPPDLDFEYEETDYQLEVGHSDYFADEKRIQISTRIRMGTEEGEVDAEGDVTGIPFYLHVDLVGIFTVDESVFPPDRIYEWANANAMYVMYPYLREHVFALTSRAGFRPLLLELLEVPLFTIAKQSSAHTTQTSTEAELPAPAEENSHQTK